MVGKFGKLPHGSYGTCQAATVSFCVPNHGIFCHGCLLNFYFGVHSFGTEIMAAVTKINMEKMPLRGENLPWPKHLF